MIERLTWLFFEDTELISGRTSYVGLWNTNSFVRRESGCWARAITRGRITTESWSTRNFATTATGSRVITATWLLITRPLTGFFSGIETFTWLILLDDVVQTHIYIGSHDVDLDGLVSKGIDRSNLWNKHRLTLEYWRVRTVVEQNFTKEESTVEFKIKMKAKLPKWRAKKINSMTDEVRIKHEIQFADSKKFDSNRRSR